MPEKVLIIPSILSADFGHLQAEVDSIEALSDGLQLDVMDGHFVPNLSFGAVVARKLSTHLPLDAHLMVQNPEDRIEEFLAIPVQHITFHAEAVQGTKKRLELIERIRKGGATAGIAINPETPLKAVEDVLKSIDLLLVMSVSPGFGGQKFLPAVLEKVKEAHTLRPDLLIQMDGGIDERNAKQCIAAGARSLVVGSTIFRAQNRAQVIAKLRA